MFQIARWGDGGWKHNLLNMEYDDICEGLNKYLGEMWYKMQDRFIPKIERGQCPIAPVYPKKTAKCNMTKISHFLAF